MEERAPEPGTDKERVEKLKRLIEINRSLSSMLSLRPLLQHIVVTAQEITGTEACSILLTDRRSGQLHFEAVTGLRGYRVRSVTVPMEGSIAGWVVQTGKPLVVPDVRNDPRHYRGVDEQADFATHAILAVPLTTRGKVLGVLEAVNKRNGAAFTDEDVELLTVLGGQAGVAVQNALLFQESDLIAEIVHEMRTPLAAIITHAGLLQRPETTSEQRDQFAEVIRTEAVRLNRMTKDFLDLARLESGRTSLARDLVDMGEVIRAVVNVLGPEADERQIGLLVDVPPNLSPVLGDERRLHQVMMNLLGNAVRYCSAGDQVTVNARVEKDHLLVSVSDTGPGIPPAALPHIFERFYRVPRADEDVPGSGLGLCITRQIIEALGGKIVVSSVLGEGTTFTCRLPLEDPG